MKAAASCRTPDFHASQGVVEGNSMSYRIKWAVALSIAILILAGALIFWTQSAKRTRTAPERPHGELAESGRITPGWIGVKVQEATPEIANSSNPASTGGVRVADVEPDGPASKAGLKPGDYIFEYNGLPTMTARELSVAVGDTKAGTPARLKIIRNAKELSLIVVVAKRPPGIAPGFHNLEPGDRRRLGLLIEDVNPEIKALMNLSSSRGVLVIEVIPDSPAEDSGVEPGDVIHAINDLSIHEGSDLLNAMQDFDNTSRIVLSLERQGKLLHIAIQ